MKKFLEVLLVVLVFSFLVFGVNSAEAYIFVAGDGNFTSPLIYPNINGQPVDAGNQQFFTNILQGGSNVAVLETSVDYDLAQYDANVRNFYNSLSGVTAHQIIGSVTVANLAGMDLFVAPTPDDAFTAAEIAAMKNFIGGGGSIFFLGEHSSFSAQNAYINSALTGLNSNLSITDDFLDCGTFRTATGSQIASDPFTFGVQTFSYCCTSIVVGGTDLFFTESGQSFVAYEATGVPEPATFLLIGAGLIGLFSGREMLRR